MGEQLRGLGSSYASVTLRDSGTAHTSSWAFSASPSSGSERSGAEGEVVADAMSTRRCDCVGGSRIGVPSPQLPLAIPPLPLAIPLLPLPSLG